MSLFDFAVTALAAYRLQRIVTADKWPPSKAFRRWLGDKATAMRPTMSTLQADKSRSRWEHVYVLMTCAWCFGFWVVAAFVTIDLLYGVPLLLKLIFATSAVVGLLGSRDEADDD